MQKVVDDLQTQLDLVKREMAQQFIKGGAIGIGVGVVVAVLVEELVIHKK